LETEAGLQDFPKISFISGCDTYRDLRSVFKQICPEPKQKFEFSKKDLQSTIPKDILEFLAKIE